MYYVVSSFEMDTDGPSCMQHEILVLVIMNNGWMP